jgi:hypothetical protein
MTVVTMTRILGSAALVAVLLGCLVGAVSADSGAAPLVTVIRHGGLCITGSECESTFRIGDRIVSGEGYVSRPLKAAERAALLRAIGKLDVAYLREHPFKGTCPVAYDGQESIYRFRGFVPALPGCKYDLRGVEAVRLADRLLGTLKPKSR